MLNPNAQVERMISMMSSPEYIDSFTRLFSNLQMQSQMSNFSFANLFTNPQTLNEMMRLGQFVNNQLGLNAASQQAASNVTLSDDLIKKFESSVEEIAKRVGFDLEDSSDSDEDEDETN